MYIPIHAVIVMVAQWNHQVRAVMNDCIQYEIMKYRYLCMHNILRKK